MNKDILVAIHLVSEISWKDDLIIEANMVPGNNKFGR